MELQIAVAVLFIFSIIVTFGIFFYIYFELDTIKPFDKESKPRPSILGRIMLLIFTLSVALLTTLFGTMLSMGANYGKDNFYWPLLFFPIATAAFPMVLTPLGYIFYLLIFIIVGLVKNRKVFILTYIVFIILLTINITGCTVMYPGLWENMN